MIGQYKKSLIGSTHLSKEGGVCQDACDVKMLENGWTVAVIADGLGSAKHSDVGSRTAVSQVITFVEEHLPDRWHGESLISLLRLAYHAAVKAIRRTAGEDGNALGDYDTTLTSVIYNGTNAVYGHVGDGGVIALNPYGDFSLLTVPQKGEAFNETIPLRSGPDNWTFGVTGESVCALLLMTDGVFDVAYPWLLARSGEPIYIRYVRPFMDRNILNVSTEDDFRHAEKEIEDFLSGSESRQITDDKTVVGLINTDVMPDVREKEYYAEPDWKGLSGAHSKKLYADRGKDQPEPIAGKTPEAAAGSFVIDDGGIDESAAAGTDAGMKSEPAAADKKTNPADAAVCESELPSAGQPHLQSPEETEKSASVMGALEGLVTDGLRRLFGGDRKQR